MPVLRGLIPGGEKSQRLDHARGCTHVTLNPTSTLRLPCLEPILAMATWLILHPPSEALFFSNHLIENCPTTSSLQSPFPASSSHYIAIEHTLHFTYLRLLFIASTSPLESKLFEGRDLTHFVHCHTVGP